MSCSICGLSNCKCKDGVKISNSQLMYNEWLTKRYFNDVYNTINENESVGEEEQNDSKKCDTNSMVNHPKHYCNKNIETIDYILDTVSDGESFLHGNIIKYISRYKHKGNPIQDLEKAKWYINKLIEELSK